MIPIIKFEKAYDSTNEFKPGYIRTRTQYLEEKVGPSNKEGYAYFSSALSTAPHIDIFNTLGDIYSTLPSGIRDHGAIILRGSTNEYTVNIYSDNSTSLSQYFLDHPTRDGIQYLLAVSYNEYGKISSFTPIIPGLLYDHISGKILGYLKSHKADSNNNVIIELPYKTNYNSYSIQNAGSWLLNENKIIISNVMEPNNNVILNYGSSSVSFKIFPKNYSAEATTTVTIKTVNEFGDYTVAAQVTSDNILNVLNTLSELREINNLVIPNADGNGNRKGITEYVPKTYFSLINWAPSEGVKNITPNIYKVPAAFVPNGENKVLMTNVIGISANKLANNL